MSINNFSFKSIEEYISCFYWIPDYQREYSWDTDIQVDDFWRDLECLVTEKRDQHFFGQIVVHIDASREEGEIKEKRYIIDGQQRTITTVIFLSVINNLFQEIYDKHEYKSARNRCEDIRLKYIGRFSEEENELKLYLGKIDKEYFENNIQVGVPSDNKKERVPSHNRIKSAYWFFDKKLREQINDKDDVVEMYNTLNLYYSSFIKKFKVMYVETTDINEAFIIFETLNDRGKALETADLLKNHVLRIAGNRIDNVKNNWEKLLDTLDNIDTTKFIRHFWNSQSVFSRERDLYKRIRDNITNPKESEIFTMKLIESAEIYKSLVNPNDEIYFSNSEIMRSLINLKEMNARSFYPIILALTNLKFDEIEIEKIVRRIEVLILRNCVVAGKVANKYEIVFARIAQNISNATYTTSDQVLKELNKEIITDEEFFNSFTTLKIKKKSIIRYILSEINDSLNSEIQVKKDNGKIHIEHIMPQKIGDWKVSKDDHQEYLWRIGNLTLLGCEYNKKNSNKLFDDKKEMYSKSKIDISNTLINYKKWTKKEIEERQKALAREALKIWSTKN